MDLERWEGVSRLYTMVKEDLCCGGSERFECICPVTDRLRNCPVVRRLEHGNPETADFALAGVTAGPGAAQILQVIGYTKLTSSPGTNEQFLGCRPFFLIVAAGPANLRATTPHSFHASAPKQC